MQKKGVLSCAGSSSPPNDANYDLQTTNSPFSFTIARKGAGSIDAPLFSTKGQRLIFKVGDFTAGIARDLI